jgi:hypothetical protein
MTTLLRYAVLSASQTAEDATRTILHEDEAHARTVARALTRNAETPFFDTDKLLDGPYRVAVCTVIVQDAEGEQVDTDHCICDQTLNPSECPRCAARNGY